MMGLLSQVIARDSLILLEWGAESAHPALRGTRRFNPGQHGDGECDCVIKKLVGSFGDWD